MSRACSSFLHTMVGQGGAEACVQPSRFAGIDVLLLLRALLHLPSADAFRFGGCCKQLWFMLGEGKGEPHVWASLLGSARGTQADDTLWLHALIAAPLIASYSKTAQHISVLGELHFDQPNEIWDLEVALSRLRELCHSGAGAEDSGPCLDSQRVCFVGAWSFEAREVEGLTAGVGPPQVRSHPVRFRWVADGVSRLMFSVHLALSSTHTGLRLAWTWDVDGEILTEERDCIDIDLLGMVMMPGTAGGVAVTSSPTALSPTMVFEGPLHRSLRLGTPLRCILRLVFRSMGEEHTVIPIVHSQVRSGLPREAAPVYRRLRSPSGSPVHGPQLQVHSAFNEEEFEEFLSVAHSGFSMPR